MATDMDTPVALGMDTPEVTNMDDRPKEELELRFPPSTAAMLQAQETIRHDLVRRNIGIASVEAVEVADNDDDTYDMILDDTTTDTADIAPTTTEDDTKMMDDTKMVKDDTKQKTTNSSFFTFDSTTDPVIQAAHVIKQEANLGDIHSLTTRAIADADMRWEECFRLQDQRQEAKLEAANQLFASHLLDITNAESAILSRDLQHAESLTILRTDLQHVQPSIQQSRGLKEELNHIMGVSNLLRQRTEKAQTI